MPRLYYRDPDDQTLKPLDNAAAVVGPAGMPIGAIIPFVGQAAPPGWHLCDGSVHNSELLRVVLGTVTVPDLRDRFIVGAGAGYAQTAVGGKVTHVLAATETGLRDHAHTASGSSGTVSADHAHGFTTGYMNQNNTHAHSASSAGANIGGYVSNIIRHGDDWTGNTYGFLSQTVKEATFGNHAHGVTVDGIDINHTHSGSTGGISANHTHSVAPVVNASGAANATAAHENLPPYYALVYIIFKGG